MLYIFGGGGIDGLLRVYQGLLGDYSSRDQWIYTNVSRFYILHSLMLPGFPRLLYIISNSSMFIIMYCTKRTTQKIYTEYISQIEYKNE